MNKADVLSRIENAERELAKARAELESCEVEGLRLDTSDGNLNVKYKGKTIGYLSNMGCCFILSNPDYISVYEQWRADDMPVDESVEEWRGGKYQIVKNCRCIHLKRIDIHDGSIYDFIECMAITNCRAPNIKRFKHNNRPIIF